MKAVILHRSYRPYCTLGSFRLPSGVILSTIERPWLNNRPNVSCIPPGEYLCKWIERSASGKYKRCWHVVGVDGRSGILWHSGNLVRHSLGCILPGLRHGQLKGREAVLSSKPALNRMRRELGGESFRLVVG